MKLMIPRSGAQDTKVRPIRPHSENVLNLIIFLYYLTKRIGIMYIVYGYIVLKL